MRRILPVAVLTFMLFTFSSFDVSAIERLEPSKSDLYFGEVLCLPDQENDHLSGDCMPLGPSSYKSRMANVGITFPLRPFSGKKPAPSLTYLDIGYGEVVTQNAPVYNSLEAAAKHNKKAILRKIDSPYSFISYTEEVYVDGKRFYMVEYGGYMTANDVSRIGAPSNFQGITFTTTPERQFGWILFPTQTKHTPNFDIDDYGSR